MTQVPAWVRQTPMCHSAAASQGDRAGFVDAVVADPVVGVGVAGLAGHGYGQGVVAGGWSARCGKELWSAVLEGAVGSVVVVEMQERLTDAPRATLTNPALSADFVKVRSVPLTCSDTAQTALQLVGISCWPDRPERAPVDFLGSTQALCPCARSLLRRSIERVGVASWIHERVGHISPGVGPGFESGNVVRAGLLVRPGTALAVVLAPEEGDEHRDHANN